MPKIERVFLSVVLVLSALSLSAAADELTSAQIDQTSRAVVRIVAERNGVEVATGSGTLVTADGTIYTNRHVIEDATDYVIELLDDPNELPVPRFRARLTGYSMDIDFAILQIDRTVDGEAISEELALPFIPSRDTEASRGDAIFVFGYPGISDGYLTFTEGTITTIRNGVMNDERIPVWFQTDAQISPGNSGGLVVNEDGEMLGLPTSVISEDRTGGRLGGILPMSAVQVAMAQGLEEDPSRIDSARSGPIIEGGELDFNQEPGFGTAELAAGFTPDPLRVAMVSGGQVAVEYLGGDCTGYAAVAPDYRVNWSGSSSEFRVFFSATAGGDTTLLINRPDGSWVCNDDAEGGLDPMIVLPEPMEGQYDIWVGSYEAGAYVPGELYVTELDLQPGSVQASELDFSAEPFYGTVSLEAGFIPDPRMIDMEAGGSTDVSYLGSECVGYAASSPDVRLMWSGSSPTLNFFFEPSDGGDTSLIVNLPDGSWRCNDDWSGETLNPMIQVSNPAAGQYDIWVGTYEAGPTIPGRLGITERNPSQE
ncbi:S1 family peptidase [Wenzhouxiangella marina]|uniref:Uncharacterized protein n=1 Tax=Wenzhouxiangella marina TaxID=1579979 RepID=A0A0K0XZF3_9GAMM|nr:serine protease [Wenzhouxiangella marina]AKS43050.1 hypothetical protein WM2015_2692 [Wenzhouxiangella marina]MBB6087266.1 serine protease Do [Wenzhouxiangella marina]